jgi:hypothetical protein
MGRDEPPADWRQKVNPIFTLAIQFLRVIPCLIRELRQSCPNPDPRIRTVLVKACKETMPLLPVALAEPPPIAQGWAEQLTIQPANKWLAYPEVREAVARIAVRLAHAPESILKKGFVRPHWWMAQNSWSEFLEKEHISESILNALALLQLNVPLHDLTRRVAEGDSTLYTKLFRLSAKNQREVDVRLEEIQESVLERVLQPLKDQATKIVGRALLQRGEPPGYQLLLRMILFFGWDFGLCDLSVRELHNFLVQMKVVPNSYDPETLRKYRNRLRSIIYGASHRQLAKTTRSTIQET